MLVELECPGKVGQNDDRILFEKSKPPKEMSLAVGLDVGWVGLIGFLRIESNVCSFK